MARIMWMCGVSVDGYMEAPGRDISWHMVDEELHSHMNSFLKEAGGFLEGRVTYELMEYYWPTADQDPDAPAAVVEFAKIWREKPKTVYSRTLERVGANANLVHEFVADEVRALKAKPGGDLIIGSSDLAAEFVRNDLVDEYRLYIHPVVIGQGTLMLRPTDAKVPLQLIETRTFGNGVIMLRYERGRPAVGD